ncbi:hypothetical protein CFC21_108998, partial [Triticum aestivum]
DQYQKRQVHCSIHPGVKPAHSTPREPDVRKHDRFEEGETRNMELEEELKSTRDGYEEEIAILLEKNDDLIKKIGVFMGDPAPGGDDDQSKDIRSEDYIIIDDTDSDPDSSDDDYEDEAGADIMESSTDQNF